MNTPNPGAPIPVTPLSFLPQRTSPAIVNAARVDALTRAYWAAIARHDLTGADAIRRQLDAARQTAGASLPGGVGGPSPTFPVGTTAPAPAPLGSPTTPPSKMKDLGTFFLLTSPALLALGFVYLLPHLSRR